MRQIIGVLLRGRAERSEDRPVEGGGTLAQPAGGPGERLDVGAYARELDRGLPCAALREQGAGHDGRDDEREADDQPECDRQPGPGVQPSRGGPAAAWIACHRQGRSVRPIR